MGNPQFAHLCDKVNETGTGALDVLYDKEFGLPKERQHLQKLLLEKKKILKKLKSKKKTKKVINNAQWKLLFPKKKEDFDPGNFDINLIVILARYCTNQPKTAEWEKPLLKHDKSKIAALRRFRDLRNEVFHKSKTGQDYVKEFWNQLVPVVKALGKTDINPCYEEAYKEFVEDCKGVLLSMYS